MNFCELGNFILQNVDKRRKNRPYIHIQGRTEYLNCNLMENTHLFLKCEIMTENKSNILKIIL